jgi:uncharacterized membrane protein
MGSIRGIWIGVKSSLWFIPSICVLLAILASVALVEVDSRSDLELSELSPRFFGLGADGSREMLTTIAQSVITIAGVTFSITIVALSLAANQYSPRVLRNFMRDHGNQFVLGGLVGIFTYCIIVLRTIRGDEDKFVPALSVMTALVLALVAIGLFIYFIHHVATTIQASYIICSIAAETREVIEKLFPDENSEGAQDGETRIEAGRRLEAVEWHPVPALESGYLQAVDMASLKAFARKHAALLRMEHGVGEFIVETNPLLSMVSSRAPDQPTIKELNNLFTIEHCRTIEQDPAFGIRQIVDIAVKALSPSINDPTTANTSLAYLTSIFALLARRRFPAECDYDGDKLLLINCRRGIETLIHMAFGEIRQNSGGQPVVMVNILQAMGKIAAAGSLTPAIRDALARQGGLVLQMAEQCVSFPPDLDEIRKQARELEALLKAEEPRTGQEQ